MLSARDVLLNEEIHERVVARLREVDPDVEIDAKFKLNESNYAAVVKLQTVGVTSLREIETKLGFGAEFRNVLRVEENTPKLGLFIPIVRANRWWFTLVGTRVLGGLSLALGAAVFLWG